MLLLAVLLGLVAGARAEVLLLAQPGDPAWQPLTFPKIERHTRYEVERPEDLPGRTAFRSAADCSASAMLLSLEDQNLDSHPRLSWRWRLRTPLDIADETVKSGDDFAARVYVMFRFEPEQAGLLRRARQRMGETVFGQTLPGRALSFVWTSGASAGRRWLNPYSEDTAMVALRRGRAPHDSWVREEVDLRAEHLRSFGQAAAPALGLAVMTDSDGSCAEASAEFADFRLLPPRAGPADPPEPNEETTP